MTRADFLAVLAAAPLTLMENPETPWPYKAAFLKQLVSGASTILKTLDPATGRFGAGIWIVTDQNVLLPLAAAWAVRDPANPHYHSPEVLEAIMKGGDALIEAQDARGMWVFRKKDNSTWGDIFMPWTYSRWIRAFGLIRDAMPPERRARWEKALTLGFEGIAARELEKVHNIPAHHAMGLYQAGLALNRPEWEAQASAFMQKVVAAQDEGGFWSENHGPVVGYNLVYVDAVGVYYALSRDMAVLPALERAARFHANFTYPDGSRVETIDERQVFHPGVLMPNVGFTFSPEGRGFIRSQWERIAANAAAAGKPPVLAADTAGAFVLYGDEGIAAKMPGDKERSRFVLGKNAALTERRRPWFAVLSAYHAPVPQSRWIQDRQNLVSLFHDRVGLIVGGGNTKLQPLWSTFTVGDTALLFHRPGDETPDFKPRAGLFHVPARATLETDALALSLVYGDPVDSPVSCRVEFRPDSDTTARLIYSVDVLPALPVAAHVPLIPRMNAAWKTASGKSGKLNAMPLRLTFAEMGGWFEHDGWRVDLPPGASLVWPVLPHDPYRKDGHAEPKEGLIVLVLPFSPDRLRHEVIFQITA